MKHFTPRQISDAQRARKFMVDMGLTTDKFKLVIRSRQFKNMPITIEHINNAERIWGKDVLGLKGKSVRKTQQPVIEDIIEIPREIYENHPELVLEIDVSYINGLPMLTGIDTTVKNRNFDAPRHEKTDELKRAVGSFVRYYNKSGFKIKRIHADGEFKPLFDHIKDQAKKAGKPWTNHGLLK